MNPRPLDVDTPLDSWTHSALDWFDCLKLLESGISSDISRFITLLDTNQAKPAS